MHNLLRTLSSEQNSRWPDFLPQRVLSYNTIHQSTGESPNFLMFGQDPQLPINFLLGRVKEPRGGRIGDWIQDTSDAWMFRSMVSESGCSLHYEGKSGMTRGRMTHSRRDNLCTSKITQCEGAYKIQDAWSTVMYRVLKAPPSGGVVYSIAPIHDLRLRRRTVLLHKHIELPFLTLALPVPTDLGPGGGVLPPRRTSQSLQEGMEIPITSQCL